MTKVLGRAPEIDISELESLFSAASVSDATGKGGRRASKINKPEKVQLASGIYYNIYSPFF